MIASRSGETRPANDAASHGVPLAPERGPSYAWDGRQKKPGPAFTDPGSSVRVANPRQGDFAEPDQRFKGEGPALARVSHCCDMLGNAQCAKAFQRSISIYPNTRGALSLSRTSRTGPACLA